MDCFWPESGNPRLGKQPLNRTDSFLRRAFEALSAAYFASGTKRFDHGDAARQVLADQSGGQMPKGSLYRGGSRTEDRAAYVKQAARRRLT
jgi:hypothetical protein